MAANENGKANKAGKTSFFKGVRTEFAKIIWPGRETMVKQLIAVVCATAITALLIAVLDYGAQNLIDLLVKINA